MGSREEEISKQQDNWHSGFILYIIFEFFYFLLECSDLCTSLID